MKLFDVKSPDGHSTSIDRLFTTEELAKREIDNFVKRYENQGYYSTSNRERISLDEAKERCEIEPLNSENIRNIEFYDIISE
jgi:hypothetical protein